MGFDGFIDYIVRPVSERNTYGEYEFFPTIDEFGRYLQGKAKKGCSIELVRELKKPGGNAFLFASALAGLEEDITCIGAFGYPEIEDVFQASNQNMRTVSVADPGQCSALEFTDGKVMLGDNSGINEMDYQLLKDRVGEKSLIRFVEEADVLAFMNWSELRGCSDIWRGFLSDIFPKTAAGKKKCMFLDLSDCSCRDRRDVQDMMKMIREFSRYFAITLSLNANEFQAIEENLDELEILGERNLNSDDGERAARRIYRYCGLKYLFIHLRDRAYGLDEQGRFCVMTRFIKEPKCSTGGGDNFNAGLLYGMIHDLDIESSMIIGNAASGYYITHGYSAARNQLLKYLKDWRYELAEEEEKESALLLGGIPDRGKEKVEKWKE